jgi:hypothetical protein
MESVVPRHVAYIEATGQSTPERRARQRTLIAAATQQYRRLPAALPNHDPSLIAGFGFSTRTSALDALARLEGILNSLDSEWRDYVRVWDGWGRKDDREPQLADPPISGPLTGGEGDRRGVLARLLERIGR